jgi:hypothetical protein
MARDPQDRFPDIKSLALALEPFAGGVRFRSMQTLSPREAVSGDFAITPVGAHVGLEPTAADMRAPDASGPLPTQNKALEPASDSELELAALAARSNTRRGRVAMASTILGLLACSGAAVYFLNQPASQPTAAKRTSAAPSGEGMAQPVQDDKNAITAAEAVKQPEAASKAPQASPSLAAPSVSHAPAARAPFSSPGSSIAKSSSPGAKRVARSARGSLENAAPEGHGSAAASATHPLANDWDRRLDDTTAPPAAVHMPAGHINMNDFR